MFSRIAFSSYVLLAMAALAAATNKPVTTTVTVTAPAPTSTPIPASQCNTGGLQCCNSVTSASDPATALLLGLLGVAISDITALIGTTCSPIDILGIGAGGACTAQPVCCQNNDFNGVIAIGCSPVNIGL